jgi:hypothetical protein
MMAVRRGPELSPFFQRLGLGRTADIHFFLATVLYVGTRADALLMKEAMKGENIDTCSSPLVRGRNQ